MSIFTMFEEGEEKNMISPPGIGMLVSQKILFLSLLVLVSHLRKL